MLDPDLTILQGKNLTLVRKHEGPDYPKIGFDPKLRDYST
jgi:hypothetical protein